MTEEVKTEEAVEKNEVFIEKVVGNTVEYTVNGMLRKTTIPEGTKNMKKYLEKLENPKKKK